VDLNLTLAVVIFFSTIFVLLFYYGLSEATTENRSQTHSTHYSSLLFTVFGGFISMLRALLFNQICVFQPQYMREYVLFAVSTVFVLCSWH